MPAIGAADPLDKIGVCIAAMIDTLRFDPDTKAFDMLGDRRRRYPIPAVDRIPPATGGTQF